MRSNIARSGAGDDAAVGAVQAAASTPSTRDNSPHSSSSGGSGGSGQDVGNAVHLEHINLEVPDLDLARMFYSEGLGLTPDPDTLGWQRGGPFVTWYNIGRQQLHVIKGPFQSTGGTIVLQLPPAGSGSLQRVAERLARLEPVLSGTQLSFRVTSRQAQQAQQEVGGGGDGGSSIGSIAVTCPWGQRFLLQDATPGFPCAAGIPELRLPCFPGTAHLIGQFYSQLLGARVDLEGCCSSSSNPTSSSPSIATASSSTASSSTASSSSGTSGQGPALAECSVYLGPGSRLRFMEDAALGEHSPEAAVRMWSGWHAAFYIARFSPAYEAALGLGINLLDHPYRDKAPDLEAALACRQFRFKDVVRLDDGSGTRGELLYCLGHEVRSLHHPGFLRPLYNRPDFGLAL